MGFLERINAAAQSGNAEAINQVVASMLEAEHAATAAMQQHNANYAASMQQRLDELRKAAAAAATK
jgi:hypothetical protein